METLLLTAFISSFVTIWAIVKLAKRKNWFVNEADLEGIQKFHVDPVARIGGLGIFVGFSVALFLMEDQSGLLFKIWMSSLPVFVVGLYEDLDLYSFILRETDNSASLNKKVEFIDKNGSPDRKPSPIVEIIQDPNKIQSTSLQQYLEQLSRNLGSDIHAQTIINSVEKRSQQVKNAAMPDPHKLSLIQRYRTAEERQFSKSLGELIAIKDRRKNI